MYNVEQAFKLSGPIKLQLNSPETCKSNEVENLLCLLNYAVTNRYVMIHITEKRPKISLIVVCVFQILSRYLDIIDSTNLTS